MALDVIGGYRTEHRGLIDVKVTISYTKNLISRRNICLISKCMTLNIFFKGKGLMDTYWLTCKEGGTNRTTDEMETQSYFMVRIN